MRSTEELEKRIQYLDQENQYLKHLLSDYGISYMVTKRAASPGNGAVQGVWGATPTSRETDIRRQRRMSVSSICGNKCPACEVAYTPVLKHQLFYWRPMAEFIKVELG